MSCIAIIPARGGSKRIPLKNIKEFGGKPMLAWSIEAAIDSGCFDKVIVSTDDEEIARIAKKWGAEIPFMRPAALSDDYTATIPVVRHAVKWLQDTGIEIEHVCCIYATAPFISAEDLKIGKSIMDSSPADYVFSVTSYEFPIQRAIRITDTGNIAMFNPEHFSTRSQDLEEAWHDAGQFYWGKSDAWLGERPLFSENSFPLKIPRHRVQDIDTTEDWIRAELMFKAMKAMSGKV